MKIFLSWSGQRSLAVAELLDEWIKCVLQASNPWISSSGIAPGSLWFTEIIDQLRDTSVGIICITQENKDRPWLLFEAGAIAKGLVTSRVCTLLIDLKSSDLKDPLAQFNHTLPTRDSMWKLVRMLNNALDTNKLDERVLAKVFETYWPQFEKDFAATLKAHPQTGEVGPRPNENILEEILNSTRSLNARVARIESGATSSESGTLTGRLNRVTVVPTVARTASYVNGSAVIELQSWANSEELSQETRLWVARIEAGDKLRTLVIRAQDRPNDLVEHEIRALMQKALGNTYSLEFELLDYPSPNSII